MKNFHPNKRKYFLTPLAPSGPPLSISVQYVGASTLHVTWLPPEPEKRNGVIVAYRLCTQAFTEHGQCYNIITVNGSSKIAVISGLQPFTWYAVSVEAGTDGGYGPQDVVHHKTGESSKALANDVSVSRTPLAKKALQSNAKTLNLKRAKKMHVFHRWRI